jgi:putative chitinase
MAIDASTLRAIAPKIGGKKGERQAAIIAAVGPVLGPTLAAYQINSPLRIAHFLGQTAQESDGYCTTQEYADGSEYEGRKDLGNTQPGDGKRYKGRGLIQLTGRVNYAKYGTVLKLPLEANPEMAAQPALSLTVACEYWKDHGLNAFADNDDIVTITQRINGGQHGIDDRRAYLAKAKAVLAGIVGPLVAAAPGGAGSSPAPAAVGSGPSGAGAPAAAGGSASMPAAAAGPGVGGGAPLDLAAVAAAGIPVLRRGASGNDVVRLQQFLNAKGFPTDTDGQFGDDTLAAVIKFQQANGLGDDGVVGQDTWNLLQA